MELLPIFRLIWRRRLLLGAGLVAAIAAMVVLGGKSATSSYVAWTQVTLDTPKSQLVAAAPSGGDTLAWRASLLSHLTATEASKQDLARRIGVRSDQVGVADPSLALPTVPTNTAVAASKAALGLTTPYVLTVQLPNNALPVIALQTAAPDRSGAQRLAQAAVAVLRSQASPTGPIDTTIPSGLGLPKRQGFVVDQVAPVRVKLLATSSVSIKAIGAPLFILVFWSAAVLLMPRLSRSIRGSRRAVAAS